MNIDKKKLYMLSAALAPAFLLVCLITNAVTRRFVLSAVVGAALIAVWLLVKKRSALSIMKKELMWVLPLFGFVGIMLIYLTGLSFGFRRVSVTGRTWWSVALPYTLIIVGSELVRAVLLMQKKRLVNFLAACSFFICDVAMQYRTVPFSNYHAFVNFFGDIVFPCIAAGILYQYVSHRYGALPVILYRWLITLYRVLIPFYPGVPSALLSFLKIAFPILAVLFIGMLYERKRKAFKRANTYIQISITTLLIVLMSALMMLISCQFRYGMLVVATESMTGSINKGDAVIYEEYDGQIIEKGQVAVFEKGDLVYIHRVVKIENIDGELRYITKGDANDGNDAGYITKEQIIGLANHTVKYVGYPTLWMRDLFR